ncbi:DUF6257 family protein [Streptomyces paromomycinus]|uniref:Uncharacterized protein n=1 Tax=Streptomyces paromomycinus TaxID=92743 RepID=A0A401W8S2_STREY|nr:DUF6257 family protein [Streptomyces paromomycinus]GCD45710.1 hypothetical protein GKJPGBOP_05448 [Streptomyces paromomycinus]
MSGTLPLTAAEKAHLAWLGARMCKRELAGPDVDQSDLQRKFDRVLDGARKRAEQNARSK